MKKTILFLLLAVTINISAQKTYIPSLLELGKVPASTSPADSVMVLGADRIVKHVPRSKFAAKDDIPTIVPVSATVSGVVDNTSLQELGGVDKTINGVRIGRGNSSLANTVLGGIGALGLNTTGSSNTAIGASALRDNTTGLRNTALGSITLRANTTGTRNTAVGDSSLNANTIGEYNVGVGVSSLVANISGNANTAIGWNTLSKNTTGSSNIAIGNSACQNMTTTVGNIGIGSGSLMKTITGVNNTAIGYGALIGSPSTTGDNKRNIAIGANSGNSLVTGDDNILIGSDIPDSVNSGLITGNKNTIIGKLNNDHRYGNGNTFIGWYSSPTLTIESSIIISDGNGNVGIRKTDTNQLLAPTLTKTLILSGGATSLVNKEYADSNLPTMTTLGAAPSSATDTGVKGDIRIDDNYIYLCVATNIWKRSPLSTW